MARLLCVPKSSPVASLSPGCLLLSVDLRHFLGFPVFPLLFFDPLLGLCNSLFPVTHLPSYVYIVIL